MVRALTTEEFIWRSKEAWGESTYGYKNTIYKNRSTKLTVTCSVHGDVDVNPVGHLRKHKGDNGCPECKKDNQGNGKKWRGKKGVFKTTYSVKDGKRKCLICLGVKGISLSPRSNSKTPPAPK